MSRLWSGLCSQLYDAVGVIRQVEPNPGKDTGMTMVMRQTNKGDETYKQG